jgi:hypothetical protein
MGAERFPGDPAWRDVGGGAMKIYISGPMTGLPGLNFSAFNYAAETLRAAGYEVVNPAEVDQGENPTWAQCMRKDIALLLQCDAIALLPGWWDSRGSRIEHNLAVELKMGAGTVADFLAPLTREARVALA